jgi:hypothetical protein
MTLDAVNAAVFYGQPIAKSEKVETANWIASRQGQPGSYAGMFAPTELDLKSGFRVFTGEQVRSGAATRHILGEEACRALILLEVKVPAVKKSLALATAGIYQRLIDTVAKGYQVGTYCCGTCTGSFWRHLAVGGIKDINPERWLAAGMKRLKSERLGNGKWRRFPFYYTLLALNEIELPAAVAELKYAAPVCERYLKRANRKNKYSQRRRILVERILEKC